MSACGPTSPPPKSSGNGREEERNEQGSERGDPDRRAQRSPEDGITKAEFVNYYRTVSRLMLPHLRGRPLVMERHPDGYRGRSFIHKDVPDYFPDWIHRREVPKEGGTVTMMVCDDTATLAYLANQSRITPHPWLARADRLDCPDRLVFDLDPPGDDFEIVRWTARRLRDLLTGLGLAPAVMTTGSRGLHLLVLLDRRTDFDTARAFARSAADLLAARHPDKLTTAPRKDKRRGRLNLDTQRNAYAQTSVAPYAVRPPPRPHRYPVTWDELDDPELGPQRWTLRSLHDRLSDRGDAWKELSRCRRSLAGARRRLDALVNEEAA
ncbi:DNA polymerase domain-containing protein [Streptomyces sp. NPDC049627]|uniref:DNA polymerase domain-containing protein n=1 Tax=Streptomyces sp. NPDC049627 TaxID=3365595 RepID=UPI0037BBEF75